MEEIPESGQPSFMKRHKEEEEDYRYSHQMILQFNLEGSYL